MKFSFSLEFEEVLCKPLLKCAGIENEDLEEANIGVL